MGRGDGGRQKGRGGGGGEESTHLFHSLICPQKKALSGMNFSNGRPILHQASGTSLLSNTSTVSTRSIVLHDKEYLSGMYIRATVCIWNYIILLLSTESQQTLPHIVEDTEEVVIEQWLIEVDVYVWHNTLLLIDYRSWILAPLPNQLKQWSKKLLPCQDFSHLKGEGMWLTVLRIPPVHQSGWRSLLRTTTLGYTRMLDCRTFLSRAVLLS